MPGKRTSDTFSASGTVKPVRVTHPGDEVSQAVEIIML